MPWLLAKRPQILVTSPYGSLRENLPALLGTGVEALHLDLVHGVYSKAELESVSAAGVHLVAGVVNGRNVWRADVRAALKALEALPGASEGAVSVASSTSPAACAARPGSGRPRRGSRGRPGVR